MAKCDSDSLAGETRAQGLLERITCPACCTVYSEAVTLPCLHYFCKKCRAEPQDDASSVIYCGACKKSHVMSNSTLDQLTLARETSDEDDRLISAVAVMTKGEDLPDCGLCTNPSSSSVNAYCYHCSKFLCSFCEDVHMRLMSFMSHVVLRSDEVSAQTLNHRTTHKKMVCSLHGKETKLYCSDCDQLICFECRTLQHRHHYCQNLHEALETVRQGLNASKDQLIGLQSALQENLSKMESCIDVIKKDGKEATKFINHSFNIVLNQFEKYRVNLLKSLDNKVRADTRELTAQKLPAERSISKLEALLRHIQWTLEQSSPEETVLAHRKILQQVTEKEATCSEQPFTAEEGSGEFEVYKSSSARIIGAIGDSLKCADPIMCSCSGNGAKCIELGQEGTFVLTANQSNDAPCQALQNIRVEMHSMDDCISCDTKISALKGSQYEVTYTPKVQGQHIMKVKVNGKPIVGNPFKILVKRPILQRKKPLLVIEGVKKLGDIAIHRDGSLLCTQHEEGAVVSIDKRGAHIRKLLTGLAQPFGIATNHAGEIFVSLNRKCCVQKYSKNLKLVESVGCKETTLGHFNKPGRMALNKRGELFVCDVKNSRIQVFDDDLEYLRWYSLSRPTGLHVSSQGDVYTAENGKSCLTKISDITKMGIVTLARELSDPQGVYVDEDYVYVVERERGVVSVLSHGGEIVKEIGKGLLKQPSGIVGDEDGYLYVCDEALEAIFVF